MHSCSTSTTGDPVKKLLAAIVFGVALFGPIRLASADPIVTECHSATVTVNGQSVVDQAACNTLPPQ
jgi:hypothetical protein